MLLAYKLLKLYNPYIILQGDRLSDHMLMFGVLIVMLPVVIVLTAWSIVGYSHTGLVHLNPDVSTFSVSNISRSTISACMCRWSVAQCRDNKEKGEGGGGEKGRDGTERERERERQRERERSILNHHSIIIIVFFSHFKS